MDTTKRSLSTCCKADLTVEPSSSNRLRPQKGCICLDKLVDEERERHAKNIAFQKALIKRLEASEKRLTYDDWDEDDDDGEDDSKTTSRKRSRVKTEAAPRKSTPTIKAATVRRQFEEQECLCYKKIRKEERKRKKFVRRLEKEQEKYTRKHLKAQRKYEKRRVKAYKKCERLQGALDKKYGMEDKNVKITQGDETYSVFIHMDPGDCGCSQRQRFVGKLKEYFFKYCVCCYIIGTIFSVSIYYVYSEVRI